MKKDLNLFIDEVLGKTNTLGTIYKEFGNYSLYDYVNFWSVNNGKLDSALIHTLSKVIKEYYPQDYQSIVETLLACPMVSTIDHYGILNHPFFINANLVYSLRRNVKYLICFPTAGVSLNNSSWPGSLMRFCPTQEARWSFFPEKFKHLPVLSAPAIFSDNKIYSILPESVKKIFREKNIFSFSTYLKQASSLSSHLWQTIFPKAPVMVYVPLEKLVNQILVEIILPNQGHPLNFLLFSEAGWQLLNKYFWEVKGAFGKNFGSFLFWGIGVTGERVALVQQQNWLIGQQLKFSLDENQLTTAIHSGQLYPTSLVCFIVLMHYGLTALGGFNQVNWLAVIKANLIRLWQELGKVDLANQVMNVITENFAEGNLSFLFYNQQIYKPSAIDILLKSSWDLYPQYVNLSKKFTVAESIATLLPEIYKITVPKAYRQKALEQWSDLDIIQEIGLQNKINAELDF
jgi:hypothetical protein